jgi:BON domain
VDISFRDGIAELIGTVTNISQRDQVLHLVRGVAGVQKVIDHLTVAGAIVPVQATLQPVPSGEPLPPPPPARPAPGNAAPEATPIFQAPAPAPHDLNPPRMPPYAWPTYAPYNNYSRVGYPQAYPYNSWPFIGPMYPFPKIPPGWRSVRLEWDDGFWWYSKTASRHDWWKLRYY